VSKVDLEKKTVEFCTDCKSCGNSPRCDHYKYFNKSNFTVNRRRVFSYDYIVFGMGSQPNFFGVKGADKYSLTLSSIKNAERIKRRTLEFFELANHTNNLELKKELLTFIVVGAGATGTEYIVELHELCKNVLSEDFEFINFERDCRIILVEAMDKILPNMGSYLAEYAMRNLKDKNIEVMTKTQVTEITDCSVELNGNICIPTHNVMWAAGVKANELISSLPLEKDRIGRVKVGSFMHVEGKPSVFALGDNACFIPEGETSPLMQTAQVAVQESKIVAGNIIKLCKEEPLEPFKFVFLGATVSLGGKKGVADLVGKLDLKGFSAWLSWKLTYFKHLLITEKPSRALWDWLYDMLYNRHLARFKLHD